jgi:hypothetical protein
MFVTENIINSADKAIPIYKQINFVTKNFQLKTKFLKESTSFY